MYKPVTVIDVWCSELSLTPYNDRRMKLDKNFTIMVQLENEGLQVWTAKKGYISDGRSGGKFVDFILPHWGNLLYAQAIVLHDMCFSSQLISQEMANDIFEQMLKRAGIGRFRRRLAFKAVSSFFGDIAYDTQDKQDKMNMNKVSLRWDSN